MAALLLSIARLFFTSSDHLNDLIEDQVSAFIGLPVQVEKLQAAWSGIRPELQMKGVQIFAHGIDVPVMLIGEIRVVIDVFGSLVAKAVKPAGITLVATDLPLVRKQDGRIGVDGFPEVENAPDLVSLVLGQKRFALSKVNISWDDLSDEQAVLRLQGVDLYLKNTGTQRKFRARTTLPESFGEELEVVGNVVWHPRYPDQIDGTLYVKGTRIRLASAHENGFLKQGGLHGLSDLELWVQVREGQAYQIQSRLAAQSIAWGDSTASSGLTHVVDGLRGELTWKKSAGRWTMYGDRLEITDKGSVWPVNWFRLGLTDKGKVTGKKFQFAVDALELADALPLAVRLDVLSEKYREMLSTMDLQGLVHDLQLEAVLGADGLRDLVVATGFSGLGCSAWKKYPGVQGLEGKLAGNLNLGQMVLHGNNVSLQAPRWFREPISVERLGSSVRWHSDAGVTSIMTTLGELKNPDISLRGRIRLDVPATEEAPFLDMQLHILEGNVASTKAYLPAKIMPRGAVRWLDRALNSGVITSGAVLYHGQLDDFPFSDGQGSLQASINVEEAVLEYREKWPRLEDLEAQIRFRNNSMEVLGTQGEILGAEVLDVTASIADLKRSDLEVRGKTRGSIESMLRFLKESPLRDAYGDPLGPIETRGAGVLNIDLSIPLRKKSKPLQVRGELALDNNGIRFPAIDLAFSDVAGKLLFTRDEISARKLQGRLKNKPVIATMGTDVNADDKETWIKLSGPLGLIEDLQEVDFPILSPSVSGSTQWHAMIRIPKQSPDKRKRIKIELNTDLQGVQLQLPQPLGKTAEQKRSLRVSTSLVEGQLTPVRIWYGKDFNAVLQTDLVAGKFAVSRGTLNFGKARAELPEDSVLRLTGRATQIPVMDWIDLVETGKKRNALPFLIQNLEVEYLHGVGLAVERVSLHAGESNSRWDILLQGPASSGTIQWIPGVEGADEIQVRMEKLSLDVGPQTDQRASNPAAIPVFDIKIEKGTYNNIDLGKFVLQTSPVESGMRIDLLEMDSEWAKVNASGTWLKRGVAEISDFTIALLGNDLGKILDTFGYTGSVSGGVTEANLTGFWDGPPYDISLEDLSGKLQLSVRGGQLLEVEPGAGRIFGLLSLQALPRRLLGDFGDLFKKGFSFDVIRGNFALEKGDAYTNDLEIEGPAAKILITGRTGLSKQDYDQLMTVTPGMGSGLPLAGVLAVGPVAGAAIFIADKLLVTSNTNEYRITGSWDEPKLEKIQKAKPSNPTKDPGFIDEIDE